MTDPAPLDRDEPVTSDDTSPEQAEGTADGPAGLITLGSADGVVCEGDRCWVPTDS